MHLLKHNCIVEYAKTLQLYFLTIAVYLIIVPYPGILSYSIIAFSECQLLTRCRSIFFKIPVQCFELKGKYSTNQSPSSLTHSLTHSTHSLTHSLTHSINQSFPFLLFLRQERIIFTKNSLLPLNVYAWIKHTAFTFSMFDYYESSPWKDMLKHHIYLLHFASILEQGMQCLALEK